MVWKINNNCQIFLEKTDSIAGRQKEIIPHVSAYYVDKYTTISEKGVKTGSNRLCGTANQELLRDTCSTNIWGYHRMNSLSEMSMVSRK